MIQSANSRNLVLRAFIPTAIAGALCVLIGYLAKSNQGLIGAAFAVAIVLIFFTVGQLALDSVLRKNPTLAMTVAMLLYLVKIGVLFVLLLIFKETSAFDTKVFAATILVETLVWTGAEVWAFATAKVFYVNPISESEEPGVNSAHSAEPDNLGAQ